MTTPLYTTLPSGERRCIGPRRPWRVNHRNGVFVSGKRYRREQVLWRWAEKWRHVLDNQELVYEY